MLQTLGEVAFGTPKGGQTQADRRFPYGITLANTRQDLFFDHHFKFGRYARSKEHQAAIEPYGKTAGGTNRVIDKFGAGRNFRLLAVAWRHHTATLGKKALHAGQPLFMQNQRFALRRRGGQRA